MHTSNTTVRHSTKAECNLQNSGFALVIALSLMAFVLLLLLSITTLVQVETQSSATQVASIRAKQNALLGLNIALSQLQKTTGPDQRITARADIFDSNPKSLADDNVENPFWLGVYKTVEVGSETQPLEALRTWATDRTQIDRVDWLVALRPSLDGSIVDPVVTDVVTLNGGNTDHVVTLATYNDNSGNLVPVQAGKIDVSSTSGAVDGRYSWWIADENAKFRINVTQDDTVPVNGQAFEPRWAVMAPHQSNPSIISELSSFDVTDATQRDKLKRAYSAESLQLVDPAWSTWVKENGSDFTVVSQSVPVDVTQGRLKEDLTVYLETDDSGLSDTDNIVRGSTDEKPNHYEGRFSNLSTQIDYEDAKLPKFGLIKSWYEAGSEIQGFSGGTPPAPRPHEVEQHGLHPVILRTAVYFGLSFDVRPSSGVTRLVYLIYPKFVLWNPHNVPIAPAKYVVQVRAQTTLNAQIDDGGLSFAATNVTRGFNYVGNLGNSTDSFAHFNWSNNNTKALKRNPNEGKYQISSDDEFPYLTFVIDNDGFAPGETLLYTARDKLRDSEYVNTDIKHFESNFSTSAFNDHNILTNENEGSFGFFYIVSNVSISPVTATAPDPPHVTYPADELEAAFYFRDTLSGSNAPEFMEPSLTTKLYHVDSGGDLKLLEFIDLSTDTGNLDDTTIDWEHINAPGQQSEGGGDYDPLTPLTRFRSIVEILKNKSLANYIRGHGFVTSQMGGDPVDSMRLLARHNLAVSSHHRDDPLVADLSSSRIHADAIPARNWFNGTNFASHIPKDYGAYNVVGDGYDTPGGYGLHVNYGEDLHFGNTVYPLYDFVRSETGLLSLGFLKNVNFAQWYWQPSFSFGNSEAHTHVARDAVQETHGGVKYTDLSYLLNESLWDRFFVSTIPQDIGTPVTENTVLPNGRNQLVSNSAGIFPDAEDLRSSETGFEQAAASVMVEGGFNVNSTSVDAWRMFLASHLGESVLSAEGSSSNDIGRAPITSRAFPILAETAAVDVASPQTWSALRSLTEAEINLLATAMVEEVKLRGPFLSMADFVNRRLVADGTTRDADFLGLKGTLQAAIDKTSTSPTSASLNNKFYEDAKLTPTQAPGNTQYPEHETGMPSGENGSTMFGAPGFLTQADVLAGLGSLMTVRGDTFTIRSYGESLSGISGNIESKVWCEAVVQRIAEPVDSNDSIINPTGNFGRQYKILNFRWLNENEVL